MIRIEKLNKGFGPKRLFKDFSMEVKEKEKVLLRAPSGSGKSTLVKLLLGFEKPDSGTISVLEKPLSKHTLKEIRKSIAYVSQDSDLPNEKLSDILASAFSYKVNSHLTLEKDKLAEYMHLVHLEERLLDEKLNALSGGERQRFALVLALLLDRPILILDEITSGLDEELKRVVIPFILGLDKTVVVITHDSVWKDYGQIREVLLA